MVGYGLGKKPEATRGPEHGQERNRQGAGCICGIIFLIFNDNLTDGGIQCAGNESSSRHYFCWAVRKWAIGPAFARDSVTSTQLDPKIYVRNQRKF